MNIDSYVEFVHTHSLGNTIKSNCIQIFFFSKKKIIRNYVLILFNKKKKFPFCNAFSKPFFFQRTTFLKFLFIFLGTTFSNNPIFKKLMNIYTKQTLLHVIGTQQSFISFKIKSQTVSTCNWSFIILVQIRGCFVLVCFVLNLVIFGGLQGYFGNFCDSQGKFGQCERLRAFWSFDIIQGQFDEFDHRGRTF